MPKPLNFPKELEILNLIATELGYKVSVVDRENLNLIKIQNKDTDRHYFASDSAGIYPLNSRVAAGICSDKIWTNLILEQAGFSVVPGRAVLTRDLSYKFHAAGYDLEATLDWASGQNYPLFIKPNRGSMGRNASYVWNKEDLVNKFNQIAVQDYLAVLSPVFDQPEYRIFWLQGRIVYSYQRHKAHIIGNGEKNIQDLIDFALKSNPQLVISKKYIDWQLNKKSYSSKTILPKLEKISLTECSNIAQGGQVREVKFVHNQELEAWVSKIAVELGCQVCGIDVFSSAESLEDPGQLRIIEVNSSPGLAGLFDSGHKKVVKEIWQEILESGIGKANIGV